MALCKLGNKSIFNIPGMFLHNFKYTHTALTLHIIISDSLFAKTKHNVYLLIRLFGLHLSLYEEENSFFLLVALDYFYSHSSILSNKVYLLLDCNKEPFLHSKPEYIIFYRFYWSPLLPYVLPNACISNGMDQEKRKGKQKSSPHSI